jgi:hypothetical protein
LCPVVFGAHGGMWDAKSLGRFTPTWSCHLQPTWPLHWGLSFAHSSGFPWQIFHILGISHFLSSTLWLWLHSHSYMHHPLRGYLQELWPCHTLLGLSDLPLKSGWKPPWPHNSCILYACKTSIMWTVLRFVTSLRSSLACLDHGFYNSIRGSISLGHSEKTKCPGTLLKAKFFKWVYTFILLICDALKASFIFSQCKVTSF